MTALDDDVRLPNGVIVRIRSRDGELVAQEPWGGKEVAHAAWRSASAARAAVRLDVAPELERTPLAAHLLARLARLADEALIRVLVVPPGTLGERAAAYAREVLDAEPLAGGGLELRTEDWPEALARVRRIGRPGSRRFARSRAGVVIAGGGVAGLECLMALRDLAGPELPIRLVAPGEEFVYRPQQVAEPFSLGRARRYPLAEIVADFGAELVAGTVAEVRADAHEAVLADGSVVAYEALVLALGAVAVPAFSHAITFGQPGAREALHGLLADLECGYVRRVAFVAPGDTTWTLPLYELALMTAHEVWAQGIDDVRFTLVTPEPAPLAVFGPPVSAEVGGLLDGAGIEFVGSTYAEPGKGVVSLDPGGRTLKVDRVVALPRLTGPGIAGVPADAGGFIPTDLHGRVADAVFAAGDATAFPIKQGGLAAQQAGAVAEAVAAMLGAPVVPRPFKPVLRGLLRTGGADRFLRAGIGGGEGDGEVATGALWSPPAKVAGSYLAPYLQRRDAAALTAPAGAPCP